MKAERELVQGGKKPFYLKKSDEKTLELVEQYKKAKQDGSLEKKLRTKRKRTSSKVRALLFRFFHIFVCMRPLFLGACMHARTRV